MQSSADLWTLNAARQQRSETLANFSLRWKLWTVHNSYVYIVQFTRRMSDFRVKKFQTLLQNLLRVLSLSHIKWPQNLCSHTMQRKWIFVAFGALWVRRVVTFNWPFIFEILSETSGTREKFVWIYCCYLWARHPRDVPFCKLNLFKRERLSVMEQTAWPRALPMSNWGNEIPTIEM